MSVIKRLRSAAKRSTLAVLSSCFALAAGAADLTVGVQIEPPVLDPTVAASTAIAEVVYGNVFEPLVRLDAQAKPIPGLAERWHISPDGRRYVFELRRGVRFHDGSPFNASSAKFSLARALAPDSVNPQRSLLASVSRILAPDDRTLVLELAQVSGGLLQALAMPAFVMVSPQSVAANAQHPVGTGPFRFEQWRRGERVRLLRFDAYWGTSARLDAVTFKFIGDPSAAYAALMAGDVLAFPNYPAAENLAQFRADKRFAVQTGLTEGEVILSINRRRAPLDQLAVRQAISYALDRQAIIDGAMYGQGQAIGSHLSPRHAAYIDLTGVYQHNLAQARRLLAAAGKEVQTLVLKLPPPAYARRAGEVVAAQLTAAGFRIRIEQVEWGQWIEQVFLRHDFDLTIVSHAEPLDQEIYGREGYYFGEPTPAVREALAKLDTTTDPDERAQWLRVFQRTLADEALNGFLFQYPRLLVADKRVHGLRVDGVIDGSDVSGVWLDPVPPTTATHADKTTWTYVVGVSGLGVMLFLGGLAWRHRGPQWLIGRAAVLFATLAAASAIVFIVVQVAPGDPVRQMMGLQADEAAVAATRDQLGLSGAAPLRYGRWLVGLAQGDLGMSYTYRVSVAELIGERLAVSLPLALYALVLATALAFPLALVAVRYHGRTIDVALTGLIQLGVAIPNFWLGILLVSMFAITLHWVPAGGFAGWESGVGPALATLTLPAVALALPQAAILARVLRAALLQTQGAAWVRTARAKGRTRTAALVLHALPNAMLPVLALLGMQLAFLIGGAVIVENVFYLPGLGRLLYQAIVQRDLIVVQAVVLLLIAAVVVVSFVVDLLSVAVDPRLHERRAA